MFSIETTKLDVLKIFNLMLIQSFVISKLLNIDERVFRQTYLKKVGYRFSLKEKKVKDSYDCIFFDRNKNGCSVYEARPLQCRTFPFWDYFRHRIDELKSECPGIIHD